MKYVCMYVCIMQVCTMHVHTYKDGYRAISNADSKRYYIRIYVCIAYVRTCMHFHYFW